MNPTDLCRRYVEAWNRHDAAAILGCFALGGHYVDPGTGGAISGARLKAHAESLWSAFPDLAFEAEEPILSAPDRVALPWTMTGTHDGQFEGVAATGRRLAVPAMNLLRIVPEGIASATGYSDSAAVARQLGLQVIVQPEQVGPQACGISRMVRTGRTIGEGAVGITELLARSDEEMQQVQELEARIAADLVEKPGFIGLTVSVAGRRVTTMSTWDSVWSLRQSMIGETHAEAMRQFLGSGLAEGGTTSVWLPVSASGFRRCPQCARMRRLEGRAGRCECGEVLEAVA